MKKQYLGPAILLTLLLLSLSQAISAVKPGNSIETAGAVDLSMGGAILEGSLTEPLQQNHYYALKGLGSGVKIVVNLTLRGLKPAHAVAALYSAKGARLTGYDLALGAGNVKKLSLSYALAYAPGENRTLYLRIGKSRGALNYTAEISVEYLYDYSLQSARDAGDKPSQAIEVPAIPPNQTQSWIGYLSSSQGGDDHEDYYKFSADLSPGAVLRVQVTPSKNLRIRATLYTQDLFPLKQNQSELSGQSINLEASGEWEAKRYTFYLEVDNLGGTGGDGEYSVKAWVEGGRPQGQQTQTAAAPPTGVSEQLLKTGIIAAAVALIAISIAVLVLRRRRAYTVEEVGWWGGGETW
ncbi:MAG: hypothetical protein J7J94_03080 [Thaumarchaeota archaeon]|nr:hypothetical protein [Nitrososphaerota archaeon]